MKQNMERRDFLKRGGNLLSLLALPYINSNAAIIDYPKEEVYQTRNWDRIDLS